MKALIVLENPKHWNLHLEGASVVSARDYLHDPSCVGSRRVRVFNLCRSYRYQTVGYYVSLLAGARGHRPLPSVATLQDLRRGAIMKIASQDINTLIQKSLDGLKSDVFELSIYFGRNLAKRYDRLATALFGIFPAPLLRAQFRYRDSVWKLETIRPIAAGDIPESHEVFVAEQALRYFARPPRTGGARQYRFDLAILRDDEERCPPSNGKAIERFIAAAKRQGLAASVVGKEDYARISEFDALFIRETTAVEHYTYRFARRAEAEGLVVIDDAASILRCTNKVFQAEAFARHGIPCPQTYIVGEENVEQMGQRVTFPCVIKQPDSAFSAGVSRAMNLDELRSTLDHIFKTSELAIVQAFVESSFDWRVGVLDGRPLFVCKYYFAPGDWRIQTVDSRGRHQFGRAETLPVADAPRSVIDVALRAAACMGNGLYGIDIKETPVGLLVMEVNDNPNIDAGIEDAVAKDAVYSSIMDFFRQRLEMRGVA